MAAPDARAEDRVNAQLRARVRASGPEIDAQVLDASSRGMLLTAANPPQRGEIVEVMLGRQVVVGQVRWSHGCQFGVKLGDKINVQAFVTGRGEPIYVRPAPAAMAAAVAKADDTGLAYNFIFFAAATVASLGFLAAAVHRFAG